MFGRIESFFKRLETYTDVPLTPAMMDKMVEIIVEVIDILATATKEMNQSRASEFVPRYAFLSAHICPEKIVTKIAGWTDLEHRLQKLDKLTNEELEMAVAQTLKISHGIAGKGGGSTTVSGASVRGAACE